MDQPNELAHFVLADAGKSNAETLAAAIRSSQTRTVTLPAPVPVVLFYATVVSDRQAAHCLLMTSMHAMPLLRALRGE